MKLKKHVQEAIPSDISPNAKTKKSIATEVEAIIIAEVAEAEWLETWWTSSPKT